MTGYRAADGKAARPRRRILTAPRLIAAAVCFAGGFIVVNAVALQTERHPAPMFQPVARKEMPRAEAAGAKSAAFDARPAAGARPLPERAPAADRPAPLERAALAEKLARDDRPAEKPRVAIAPPPKDVPGTKTPAMRDELADLVRRNGDAEEKPQRTVLDVQRALNKAGYGPLSEDGQMGPSTRAALARFEQDRKLPPKGELSRPVLRALASASGIAIAQ